MSSIDIPVLMKRLLFPTTVTKKQIKLESEREREQVKLIMVKPFNKILHGYEKD